MIAIDIGQEEARGRTAHGILEEAGKTALEPLRLPGLQGFQPAQGIAWLARRVVQRLVTGQATRQARDRIGGGALAA